MPLDVRREVAVAGMNSGEGQNRAKSLIDRFYASRPGWTDGTTEFHSLIRQTVSNPERILEVGPGVDNKTSALLSSLAPLDGIDPDRTAATNSALDRFWDWDPSGRYPIPDEYYDACVSDYVVEHVDDPDTHLAEIWRVLKPGGKYAFRTPNRRHYVTLAARLTPHVVHLKTANWLRARANDGSDPFPTRYRLNTRREVLDAADRHRFRVVEFQMIEKEPSYLVRAPMLFRMGVAYERVVNSTQRLAWLRANMLVVLEKSVYGSR